MNADELMDARLRAAGERWREQQAESSVVPDVPVQELAPKRPPHRTRFAWLATAAAVVVVAVGAGLLIANRGSSPKPAPVEAGTSGLYDRTWQLQRIIDRQGNQPAVAGRPTVRFERSGQMTGNNGCNGFGGPVTVSAASIRITGDISFTANGCIGPGDAFSAVDDVITHDMTWSIAGSTLVLRNTHGALVYVAPKQIQLAGTDWRLTGLTTHDGKAVKVAGDPSLRIDGTRLSGTDGCNHLSGAVRLVQGSKLVIGSLATTEMACADADVIATAAAVDRILTGTLQWRLAGGTLTLHGSNGTLVYAVRPAPTSSTDPKDLLGTWTLTSVERDNGSNGNGVASSNLGTTLTFTQGRIRIAHACYIDAGTVVAGHGTLLIRDVRLVSAIPCPSSAGSPYDQQADDVLTGTVSWRITDHTLTISKGTTKLVFDRAPAAAQSSASP